MVDDLDLGLIISTSAESVTSANNLLDLSTFLCRQSYCLNCDSFISFFSSCCMLVSLLLILLARSSCTQ